MARANAKGKSFGDKRHIRLYHDFTDCPAWRDLSGNAVKLLIALMRLDKGGDNGALFLSVRDAAAAVGVAPNTAAKLFRELEGHGFIAAVQRGHFTVKKRLATTWRLTWLYAPARADGPGQAASNEFRKWQPQGEGNKTRYQKLTATVPIIATGRETPAPSVPKMATVMTETSRVSNLAAVAENGTQVVCHRRGAETDQFLGGTSGGKIGGPSGVDGDLVALRHGLAAHLDRAPVGEQTRIAQLANVPGGTLSKFLAGRGLNRTHFLSLSLQLHLANAAL